MNDKSGLNHLLAAYFDVFAVLWLAVLPDLLNSILTTISAVTAESSLNALLVLLLARSLQVSVPILLIMKLRQVKWADYGFRDFDLRTDGLIAFGLALLGYLAYFAFANSLLLAGYDFSADADALPSMTLQPQAGIGPMLLVLLASCANGFAEELAIRSYLITRLKELNVSAVLAAILTTLLFAAYHSYQGRYGVISAFAVGAVFSTYFVVFKRFWPIAIAHAIMDFVPLMWLLQGDAG